MQSSPRVARQVSCSRYCHDHALQGVKVPRGGGVQGTPGELIAPSLGSGHLAQALTIYSDA